MNEMTLKCDLFSQTPLTDKSGDCVGLKIRVANKNAGCYVIRVARSYCESPERNAKCFTQRSQISRLERPAGSAALSAPPLSLWLSRTKRIVTLMFATADTASHARSTAPTPG